MQFQSSLIKSHSPNRTENYDTLNNLVCNRVAAYAILRCILFNNPVVHALYVQHCTLYTSSHSTIRCNTPISSAVLLRYELQYGNKYVTREQVHKCVTRYAYISRICVFIHRNKVLRVNR